MKPTLHLRWKVPPGTSTRAPVLQQLWEPDAQDWALYALTVAAKQPMLEWHDVEFVATTSDEIAVNTLSDR